MGFSVGNEITPAEIDQGSVGDETLMAKFVARDDELMSLMNIFGGPGSVLAGSSVSHEGNVTITSNTNLSGLHYYDTLTINPSVTVTATGPLVIICRTALYMSNAIIDASGQGGAGGLAVDNAPSTAGEGGVIAGGGGGYTPGDTSGVGADGGSGLNAAGGVGSTSPGSPGGTGEAVNELTLAFLLMTKYYLLYKGGAGGGGGGSDGGNGHGGDGGGIVRIVSPYCDFTGALLIASGIDGAPDESDGGGGGGGGGIIDIDTRDADTVGLAVDVSGGVGGGSGGDSSDGGPGADGIFQMSIY